MRVAFIGLALAATLGATAVASGAPPIQPTEPIVGSGGLSASLSTNAAHAKPVALTLKIRAEMVCGQPGPLFVKLPDSAVVPDSIPLAAVRLNAKPAARVAVAAAHRITVTPTHQRGVMCHVMGLSLATLRFTTNAGLGNPSSAGSYTISVRVGHTTYDTKVTISA